MPHIKCELDKNNVVNNDIFYISSTATAPNSPKYSSNMNDFDLSDLDQLDIRSRHNSYDRYRNLTKLVYLVLQMWIYQLINVIFIS